MKNPSKPSNLIQALRYKVTLIETVLLDSLVAIRSSDAACIIYPSWITSSLFFAFFLRFKNKFRVQEVNNLHMNYSLFYLFGTTCYFNRFFKLLKLFCTWLSFRRKFHVILI